MSPKIKQNGEKHIGKIVVVLLLYILTTFILYDSHFYLK